MSNKILLFLVEGYTDIQSLEYPFGLYFDDVQPEFNLHFLKPISEKGDISGSFSVDEKNIHKHIENWWGISSFLKKNGFSNSDIVEIVQIIDIDGIYINDDLIIQNPFLNHVKYLDNEIQCKVKTRIVDRNLRKRHNITTLKSLKRVKVGEKNIPYSIYYFCCNLDHYIHGERNMEKRAKVIKAEEFAYQFDTGEEVYKYFTDDDNTTSVNYISDFKKSWLKLKESNISLSPCSNIGLLLQKYYK